MTHVWIKMTIIMQEVNGLKTIEEQFESDMHAFFI